MTVVHIDCVLGMRAFLADNSVDSVVTDPPYELGFMGKGWDSTGIANSVEMWREAFRVLKPGGHLLAFSGSRTYHRMVCAIEDAGFEIRDQIMWVYGSGFPKSLDVSKAIDKAAGAVREVVGEKMFADGSKARKTQKLGGNATFCDDVSRESNLALTAPATDAARQWQGWGTALKPAHEPIVVARKRLIGTVAANVLAHGTGALNIDGCRVPTNGEVISLPQSDPNKRVGAVGATEFVTQKDAEAMKAAQRASVERANALGRWPANLIHDGSDEVVAAFPKATDASAARFFYCSKASKSDRSEGNTHPTVKPTDLMRYLCRLVTPPGGTVLDPFAGSGSTGKAAHLEGFQFIGFEQSAEYAAIANARIGVQR